MLCTWCVPKKDNISSASIFDIPCTKGRRKIMQFLMSRSFYYTRIYKTHIQSKLNMKARQNTIIYEDWLEQIGETNLN